MACISWIQASRIGKVDHVHNLLHSHEVLSLPVVVSYFGGL